MDLKICGFDPTILQGRRNTQLEQHTTHTHTHTHTMGLKEVPGDRKRLIPNSASESEVTQSCPTLCDPMDWSLPGSSVHGIFQARILEMGCHFLLQEIFPTQGWTQVSRIAGRCFIIWATWEVDWEVGVNPWQGFCHKPYAVPAERQSRAPHLLRAGHVIHTHKHTAGLVKYSRKQVC